MSSHKWTAISMAGLCLMVLTLSGCKHEREDDGQAFYNDVGETDLDRRVYAKAPKTRAEIPGVDERIETANKRHSYEVGEMSLDSGAPAPRAAKKAEPKVNQQHKQDVLERVAREDAARKAAEREAAARRTEEALRAARQKAELSKPAPAAKPLPLAKPAAQAPVRAVPAPAPAPEYRTRETASLRKPERYNHGANVGEQMLGN